jgi:hypothetical protein
MTQPAEDVAASAAPTIERHDHRLVVRGTGYRLEVDATTAGLSRSPTVELFDAADCRWSRLSLLCAVDDGAAIDETGAVAAPVVSEGDGCIVLEFVEMSSIWAERVVRIVCTRVTVEFSVTVRGAGSIGDVTLLGGAAVLSSGASGVFRSGIDFPSVFVPVPTEPVQFVRPAHSSAVLGVVGDAGPGRLNGIFSPPPLCLGLGREAPTGATGLASGDWLGMSLRGPVTDLTFTTARYEPLDGGFLLRLAYEGHTSVDGSWTSPTVVLKPATSALDTLRDYRADLVAHGFARDVVAGGPRWWREPIFCGWGAQCARSAFAADSPGGVVEAAPDLARQDVYDEFLATLATAQLDPGTIVIDDRWQAEYGTAAPDLARWPDLRGWIAERHAEGRRVLLWWKAWDPAGLPAEECILAADGTPVAVDPSNPAYRQRLGRIVEHLLGAAGLDADGFKVDFTQRTPSGRSLRGVEGGAWGIAALHELLGALYAEAKAAKPDALVVTHAIHPSFGDISDMVRLNDVLERDIAGLPVPVVDQLRMRAAIAGATLPHHLVDTDQWPMPDRAQWLAYVDEQATLGVPALYYLDFIDNSKQSIRPEDLARVGASWQRYREGIRS